MKIKKGKKAFTLIELLAVIIILSIISLIVGVVIGNIIDNAKKEAYKESVRGMIKAAENYIGEYPLKHGKPLRYPVEFTCDGNTCSNDIDNLTFTQEIPKSGKIVILSAKLVKASYISNDRYCVTGPKEKLQIAKSCTDIDDTIPRIAGVQEGNVLHLTLVDNESGIDAYCVNTVNDSTSCNWISTTNNSVDHELSLSGTYYAFARDKKNNISESIEFVTGDIEKPIVTATIDGKVVSIALSDNVGVANWCITNSNGYISCSWQIPESNNFDHTLNAAGTYYVFAKDSSGNISDSVEVIAPAIAFCAFEIDYEWTEFSAGTSTAWVAPCNGLYKLEVWGAGSSGGSGGYSVGYKVFTIDETIYVSPGGAGSGSSGGWNGGAGTSDSNYSGNYSGGSGGATHMAYVTGTIASIGKTTFDAQGLLVAGGAGGGAGNWAVGGYSSACGGSGGGTSGGSGCKNTSYENPNGSAGSGGSQTSGYSFGQGGRGGGGVFRAYTGAGGGGYYGGRAASSDSNGYSCVGGGGGSGWIGGVPEIEYKGETYSPSMSNGGNSGAGKAKITLISY